MALLAPRKGPPVFMRAVEFAPNDLVLATVNDNSLVECWGVESWRSMGQLPAPDRAGGASRIRFHATGQRIAVASATGAVWFWDLAPNRRWAIRSVIAARVVTDLAYASECGRIALASGDGFVELLDAVDDQVIWVEPVQSPVTGVDLSGDGKWLVAATADQQIRAWDLSGRLWVQTTSSSVLSRVRFSSNGRGLLTAGNDGTARIWRVIAN